MTTLTPAAQAVLDAYWATPWDPSLQQEDRYSIAAVIRAAADQVVPAPHPQQAYDSCCDVHKAAIRKQLLNIATELETIQ